MVKRYRSAALASLVYGNGVIALPDELLVENVEHLQERSVLLDTGNMIGLKMTLCLGVLLTPYLQVEFHLRLVFVISGFNLNELVFEFLFVEFRICALSLVLPSGDIHVVLVITLGLTLFCLALHAEMTTA